MHVLIRTSSLCLPSDKSIESGRAASRPRRGTGRRSEKELHEANETIRRMRSDTSSLESQRTALQLGTMVKTIIQI